MTPLSLQVLLIGLAAAVPGLLALWFLYRRTVQREEEHQKLSVQRQEERNATHAQGELIAQLQAQVAVQQKTIRFLAEQVNDLQQARVREYAETEALRQENEALRGEGRELREEVRELRRGVGELIRQMEEAKLTPVWKPTPKPSPGKRPSRAHDLAALRKKIVIAFSLREIGDLAFELGVDPDEVPGETATDRARVLVTYFQDRGRLEELVALCREKRPDGGFDSAEVGRKQGK